jgi:hypothetical protein
MAPLTISELDGAMSELRARLEDGTSRTRAERRAVLRDLYQWLLRATPSSAQPPAASLAAAAELLTRFGSGAVDAMPPRPRTVFRLLLAGSAGAAWEVLIESATGIVEEAFRASTATGAVRTSWRLPLLTLVEAPKVFADLPGFRDPRFGAPDDCYDLSGVVRLRQRLDEVTIGDSAVTFGGWAALDTLATNADERVRLVASNDHIEISVDGHRLRRPDLVARSRAAQPLRTWAGWSARLDLADPRLVAGSWALALELDHAGVSRRAPIGADASELARAAVRRHIHVGGHDVWWQTALEPWCLEVGWG